MWLPGYNMKSTHGPPYGAPQGGHFSTSSEVCQYGTQMKGLATQNSTMTSVLLETTAYQFYDNKTDLKYQKEHKLHVYWPI